MKSTVCIIPQGKTTLKYAVMMTAGFSAKTARPWRFGSHRQFDMLEDEKKYKRVGLVGEQKEKEDGLDISNRRSQISDP